MLPDDFFADVQAVIAHFSEADRPRARLLVDELTRIARRMPHLADRCYADQARLFAHLREYEQALAAAERAVQARPFDETLLTLRGDLKRQAQQFAQALLDYSAVLEHNPEAVTTRMKRAETHQANGHLEAALADINEALTHEPRSLRLLYRRGLILADLRRLPEAAADFRTVADLTPDPDLRRKARQRLRELGQA